MYLMPARRTEPELLDLPEGSYTREELEGSLADIRTVNRRLGDIRGVVGYFEAAAKKNPGTGANISVLDVATGSADIPVALAKWARARGITAEITAVDSNPATVDIARIQAEAYPEIKVAVADGTRLPYADGSFEFALCVKTLHHFTDDDASRLLREVARVARRGYLVVDIRRSWAAWGLMYILTRLLTRNRLTRFDGPLTVLKSFTPEELRSLAAGAGLAGARVERLPFWHMALTGGDAWTGV